VTAVNDTRPSSLAKFLRDGTSIGSLFTPNGPAGPEKPPTWYTVVFMASRDMLQNALDVQFRVNRDV
jgi:hypothetical protein